MVENDEFGGRLKVLGWLSVLVIVVLIARAGYLQIYDGEYYAELAEGNRIRIIPAMAPRGTFFDRNGELLVQNRPGFTVSLLPLTPVCENICSQGLHWSLCGANLRLDSPGGISNRLAAGMHRFSVSVGNGCLGIYFCWEEEGL